MLSAASAFWIDRLLIYFYWWALVVYAAPAFIACKLVAGIAQYGRERLACIHEELE